MWQIQRSETPGTWNEAMGKDSGRATEEGGYNRCTSVWILRTKINNRCYIYLKTDVEKVYKKSKTLYHVFVDLEKAFDRLVVALYINTRFRVKTIVMIVGT